MCEQQHRRPEQGERANASAALHRSTIDEASLWTVPAARRCQAVAACFEAFGPAADNQLTRQTHLHLSGLLHALGKWAEAEEVLRPV